MGKHASGHVGTEEAAAQLGVAANTLRGWINAKKVPEPGWLRTGKKRERTYSKTWIDDTRRWMSE